MTLQRGLIFSTKYTRWEKGWYYLIGSYQMGHKTHKTSNLSLEIEIIFILIFSFISVKDQSFKLIAFNTRLSLNKSRVIGHKMGSFSFADFRLILKKITEFVKKMMKIFTFTIFLIWIQCDLMCPFIFSEMT